MYDPDASTFQKKASCDGESRPTPDFFYTRLEFAIRRKVQRCITTLKNNIDDT